MIKRVFLLGLMCFMCLTTKAAGPPGGGCDPDEEDRDDFLCDPDEAIPLDDHVYWLAAGGAAVGFLYLNSKKKQIEL